MCVANNNTTVSPAATPPQTFLPSQPRDQSKPSYRHIIHRLSSHRLDGLTVRYSSTARRRTTKWHDNRVRRAAVFRVDQASSTSGGSGVFIWGGGGTGMATLSSGGHTTNTFALNYRVCYNNRLYQIINT